MATDMSRYVCEQQVMATDMSRKGETMIQELKFEKDDVIAVIAPIERSIDIERTAIPALLKDFFIKKPPI